MTPRTSELFLDHAAGTATDARAIRVVSRISAEQGNPSSYNDAGRRAASLLDDARTRIGRFLNARAHEIILCATGSEANALAIMGSVGFARGRGHLVTTVIEHSSVLAQARALARHGHRTTVVDVDRQGFVEPEAVLNAIRPTTRLVSVMYANNEVGTIQPVVRIGRLIGALRRQSRSRYPLFHIDACQAAPWLPMDVQRLGADLVTLNSAKVAGPRGVAALFVRRGVPITPIIPGGDQEFGLRAGSENVAGAQGFAFALELIKAKDAVSTAIVRDWLIEQIVRVVPDAVVNGPYGSARLPNNVHVSIPGVTSERLLRELDRFGIRAGSGSACTARRTEPSHVLLSMGLSEAMARGALRLSLFRTTRRHHLDRLIRYLPTAVRRARSVFRDS